MNLIHDIKNMIHGATPTVDYEIKPEMEFETFEDLLYQSWDAGATWARVTVEYRCTQDARPSKQNTPRALISSYVKQGLKDFNARLKNITPVYGRKGVKVVTSIANGETNDQLCVYMIFELPVRHESNQFWSILFDCIISASDGENGIELTSGSYNEFDWFQCMCQAGHITEDSVDMNNVKLE